MSDKIATCKPSLISNRADYNYKLAYTDKLGAEWEFELHSMSAAQIGAIDASRVVVRIDAENNPQTEVNTNAEKVHTVIIYNALTAWNIDEPVTVANIDLLPKDVRKALLAAIAKHENDNKDTLEAELKN